MYDQALTALRSGATIVTANKRLTRTLRGVWDREQRAAGLRVWLAPDILNWNAWLTRLYSAARLSGSPGCDRALLSEQGALILWQQCLLAAVPDWARNSPPSINQCTLAMDAWRMTCDWEARSAPEWTRSGLTQDQRIWLQAAGLFRDRCAAEAWVDSASLPDLLCQAVSAESGWLPATLLVYGFDALAPVQDRLLQRMVAAGVRLEREGMPARALNLSGVAAENPRQELRFAAVWAREQLRQAPGQSIAVVIPDLAHRARAVEREFRDVLQPDWRVAAVDPDAPVNVSYGMALAEFPVIRTALWLLDACQGRMQLNELSQLLLSGWLAGSGHERFARAQLDMRLRSEWPATVSLAAVLPECRRHSPVFARILTTLLTFKPPVSPEPADRQIERTTTLLEQCGWPGDSPISSEVWQLQSAWDGLLQSLHRAAGVSGEQTWTEYLALLRSLAGRQLFQPEGSAQGLQVMGVLESAGHRFDKVWVCGMARELWPMPGQPNPFIPLALQRRLGMPFSGPGAALAHAEELTQRLLRLAPETVVSWPQRVDDEICHPSPLLGSLDPGQSGTALGVFADWNEEQFAHAAGSRELLDVDPPPPWRPEKRLRGGARALSLQASSPVNAFMEQRLGAFAVDTVSSGINARQRGLLLHQALEALYSQAASQSALRALSDAQRTALLQQSLKKNLDEMPGGRDPFMRALADIETEQLLLRLEDFVALDLQRQEFTEVQSEVRHDIHFGGLNFTVRLDRCETLSGLGKFIIDYKTGQAEIRDWNPRAPGNLQLPLYLTCIHPDAVAIGFARISADGVGFQGVGQPELGIDGIRPPGRSTRTHVRFQAPDSDEVIESWDSLRDCWRQLLESLAAEFSAGDFRIDPLQPQAAGGQFAVLSRVFELPAIGEEEGE